MSNSKLSSIAVGIAAATMLVGAAAEAAKLTVMTSLNRNHDQVVAYFDLMHTPMNKAKGPVALNYKGGPAVTPNRKQGAALKRGIIDLKFGPSGYDIGLNTCARLVALSTQPQSVIRKNGGWDVMQKCWGEKMNARVMYTPLSNAVLSKVQRGLKAVFSAMAGLNTSSIVSDRASGVHQRWPLSILTPTTK